MHVCTTEPEYKQMYDSRVEAESSVPPFISLIGSLLQPRVFMVDFENITYKFYSFAKALDVCFKAYFVFNLAHPEACDHFWYFVNKLFYKLTVSGDKTKPPALDALLDEINCKLALHFTNYGKIDFNMFDICLVYYLQPQW